MSVQESSQVSTPQTEDEQQVIPQTNVEDTEQPLENGDDNSTEALRMEERKAKMEQLRARMVSLFHLSHSLQHPFSPP